MSRIAALALVCASLGCIQLEAQLPEICKSQTVTFNAGAQASPLITSGAVEQDAPFIPSDASSFLTALVMTSGSLSVTPAGALDEVQILLRPPDGSAVQELQLLDLNPVGDGAAFPDTSANLLPFLGGEIAFRVTGTPPDGTTLTVSLCAAATAKEEVDFKP
jgi:hypothetical protein